MWDTSGAFLVCSSEHALKITANKSSPTNVLRIVNFILILLRKISGTTNGARRSIFCRPKLSPMKKVFFTLVFAFGLLTMQAQSDLRIGFQASPTISWLTTSEADINNNGSNFPGLKLGIIGESYFRENYAWTFGLGFAFNQGGTLIFDDGGRYWPESELDGIDTLGNLANLKYSLQYLEIPIGLKLRTTQSGYFNFAIEPQAALGFRLKAQGEAGAQGIETIEKIDIKEEVNPLYLSLGIGLTADYEVSANTILNFGIIYQNVLNDITKDVAADNSKGKMHVLTFRVGVIL